MQDFEQSYQKLNTEQAKAVDTIFGPVLVVAGPGSGKTQLLSMRVANILKSTDTLPNSILCLTFTESAAVNMRQRLLSMIGRDAFKVAIHTFHSFCTEIIGQNPSYFFFGAGYKPSDNLSQVLILREIFSKLDKKNPLSSFHEEMDYTFLGDTIASIDALKKGGFTPNDFRDLLKQNHEFLGIFDQKLEDIFSERISKNTVEKLWKLKNDIEEFEPDIDQKKLINQSESANPNWENVYSSFRDFVLLQLEQVFKQIAELSTDSKVATTPLTAWKKNISAKDVNNITHFKDWLKIDKMFTLADIYEEYQNQLYTKGLFDFSDMLLEVVKVFEDPDKIDLKYNIQEKYQFLLVDEFQDTNGVQMRLLEHVLDSEFNESEPNILAVGDDDQAVFKFQGANIENMLKFKEKYSKTQVIFLTKNYRSTQDILDLALQVAKQSSERLSIDGIEKTLEAVKK